MASETPRSGVSDSRVRHVDYNAGEVYRVVGTFRTATEVVLSPDETIVNAAVGDAISWEVAPRGSLLFIKPREHAPPTNLIVTTQHGSELRDYTFELVAKGGSIAAGSAGTVFRVQFHYPEDERLKRERMRLVEAALHVGELQRQVVKSALDQGVLEGVRNLHYTVQGASDLQPSEVSDNGQFTVMRFPANHEIPSIYMVRDDGTETLVPYDVRDEWVVVHLVTKQLRLRRNREVLCIYNEAPQPYGVNYGTETASPHVERTLKGEQK
jgi:type IV secretion system protein VirB9